MFNAFMLPSPAHPTKSRKLASARQMMASPLTTEMTPKPQSGLPARVQPFPVREPSKPFRTLVEVYMVLVDYAAPLGR